MQVRWPAPVFGGNAGFADHFPFCNPLPFLQVFYGIQTEMSIQGIKTDAIEQMREEDRASIISFPVIKGKAVYNAIAGRVNRQVRPAPDIHAEV